MLHSILPRISGEQMLLLVRPPSTANGMPTGAAAAIKRDSFLPVKTSKKKMAIKQILYWGPQTGQISAALGRNDPKEGDLKTPAIRMPKDKVRSPPRPNQNRNERTHASD